MPRCVECGSAVVDLYKDFGNGATRLTDCTKCGKVADPYVEVDTMSLFLEIFLQKEQVYRHILFNTRNYFTDCSRFSVFRLLSGLVLFDAYARWVLVESRAQIFQTEIDYVFLSTLVCSSISLGTYLGSLTWLTSTIYQQEFRTVFHGLLLSMFGILFNLLLLTWATDLRFRYGIQALVYISNLVAIKVISDRGAYWGPFLLICVGAAVRYICVALAVVFLLNRLPLMSELLT